MSGLEEFWVGLRQDGLELDRVPVMCTEVSRRNGIITYEATAQVLFTDLPADVGDGAIITLHRGASAMPLSGGAFSLYTRVREGDNIIFTLKAFEVVEDVPRYVRPDQPKRRWRPGV